MAKIERFEDLRCWQSSRELVNIVYRVCEESKLSRDFDTKSQIKRAALSVMNNIAEGFGRYNAKDLVRFLGYAQGSSNEVKSITYVLEDCQYLPIERILELRSKANETRNKTMAFIRYLRHQNGPPIEH